MAPPVFTWTGFYLGFNGGSAAGDVTSVRSFFAPPGAGAGSPEIQYLNSRLPFGDAFLGLQAGYNHQFGNGVVLGLETDFQFGLLRKHASAQYDDAFFGAGGLLFHNNLSGSARFGLDWYGTTRLRLGYALTPRFLPYLTAGLAYAAVAGDTSWATAAEPGIGVTSIVDGAGSTIKLGWAVGGGFEYALGGRLSFKADYLYTEYGGASFPLTTLHAPAFGASGGGPLASRTVGVHAFRSGLNWKFGGDAVSAPAGDGLLAMFGFFTSSPRTSWTGLYVGANAGYGSGILESTLNQAQPNPGAVLEVQSVRTKLGIGGFSGGGQVGYNYEFANKIVAGVETDLQWGGAKIRGDAGFGDFQPGFSQGFNGQVRYGQDWFGTTRVRLGYASDYGVFSYLTGGLAYSGLSGSVSYTSGFTGVPMNTLANGSASGVRLGFAIGAGGEYALTENLSIRSEFLYTRTSGLPLGGGGTLAAGVASPMFQRLSVKDVGIATTRVGLNWKLGWGGPERVVAKY